MRFLALILLGFGPGVVAGTMNANHKYQSKIAEKPKSIEFCDECCFSSSMNNRTLYTCTKTKEELFRKIP